MYWNLGKLLFEKYLEEGYGSGVVKQLSIDLKNQFPDMGLSPRNLWNIKLFYERYYQADQKLLQAVAVLPWGHNLLLINIMEEAISSSQMEGATTTRKKAKNKSEQMILNNFITMKYIVQHKSEDLTVDNLLYSY